MEAGVRDLLELYCLGAVDDDERRRVREASPPRQEMARAAAFCAVLGLALTDPVAPPARLRRRVAEMTAVRRAWNTASAWAVVAVIAAAVLGGFGYLQWRRAEALALALSDAREEMVSRGQARQDAMALMTDPETKAAGDGSTRVFANAQRGVVLMSRSRPVLPPGKAYQMWFMREGSKPQPAGVFQPVAGAVLFHFLPGALDLATLKAVAVTVEDARGADQPTSPPVLETRLGGD